MADNQRNKIFADFLSEQFRDPKSILDVASGDGRLNVCLSRTYPLAQVTSLDPKPRGNKKRIRFLRGLFPSRVIPYNYDLIVGMHPDEATWPIVEVCCKYRINFAIVPCCLLHTPEHFPGGNMRKWAEYIEEYAHSQKMKVIHTLLCMKGANHIIIGIA